MQNSKLQFKIKNYIFLVFLFGVSLVLPLIGQAAELYLETFENQYYTDETFVADVRINVGHDESINAIEAYLKFPNDALEVKDFSTGNSILTFIEGPKIDQEKGLISFIGIIPGGYSGRISGDPGKSNLLGRIIFRVRETDAKLEHGINTKLEFSKDSQVLLSDGKGTPAELATKGVIIEVQPPQEVKPQKDYTQGKDEWQEELGKDKIPPEGFKPEIIKIDDKYYLTFTTKDKNSGVDHYDVLEKSQSLGALTPIIVEWIEADSPHLLKDQSLSSNIEVKAVDKAGNEKIVKLPATYSLPWYKNYFIWVIIILVILSCLSFKLWPYLKTKK